ncbi:TonB [Plesiomonas shigelloides 302-73]|uniref:TonB n=2 Tax=Plesiomonas shigelloides TaxID=703 RepID=R8AUL3_PLESH|nr:TonB [Plesiomonas shigelloides 302-73]
MPLTLLTAGAHLRRNKRLLLASGLCMSAHAALLLFGLQPTQTRAVTLDSLSAGPALVLNLAATGAQSGAAADVQPAPQKTEPKKVVEPSTVPAKAAETAKPKQAKPVLKKEPAPKKVAPKIPEEKAPKKTVKKTERKSTDNTEQRNPVAASTSATAANKSGTTQSASGAPNTASRTAPTSAAQASGSSEPRFRVPPSAPEYPKASRMRRQEGIVLLEVKLGTQGEQLQVVLLKSSGFPLLDRSALKAVKGWQFLPQEINGQGVSHVVRIPVRFELT